MTIKVAIVGVGNCASALVQGVEYYRDTEENSEVPGLMHVNFGGYHVRDIEFVAAFEINKLKIGKDLSKAIFVRPNCCVKFANIPHLGVTVLPGPILDGVADHMKAPFNACEKNKDPVDVADVLKESQADMLLNFLPVGSFHGTRCYVKTCLEAQCAFVNCIPEFITSEPRWARKFQLAGIPVAGDDVKSQVGATIIHRALIDLLISRGVRIDQTYQLNVGGNTDFLNMTTQDRLDTKRESKISAINSLIPYKIDAWAGPNGYVPFLKDNKICHLFIQGRKFGDIPFSIDLKLSVQDSPNSAGMVIDVIRATKMALDRGIKGPLTSISSYAFKHPPIQVPDHIARQQVEEFIQGKRER